MNSVFPLALQPYLEGVETIDCSGRSIATTLFLESGYYLKIGPKGYLEKEAQFAKWFNAKGLSAEVVLFLSENKDYLLTRKAAGEVLTACLDQPKALCKALAMGLHQLHSLSVKDFPVSEKMDTYIQTAEQHYHKGCFDKSLLVPWIGLADREEAWQLFQANKHRLQRNVIVHGDYCLPNVLMKDSKFSAMIDLGQAGVGDRHIDLYWALWSLWYNLGTDLYNDYFLNCYGRDLVDDELLKTIAAIETLSLLPESELVAHCL